MAEKTKTISIRVTESQYNKLASAAKKAGYGSVSEYTRKSLFANYSQKDSVNGNVEKQKRRELRVSIGKELVKMQYSLERIPKSEETVRLKREVETIWQLLR